MDTNVAHFIDAAASLGMTPIVPVTLAELGDAAKRKEWIEQRNMQALALRAPDAAAPTVDVLTSPHSNGCANFGSHDRQESAVAVRLG